MAKVKDEAKVEESKNVPAVPDEDLFAGMTPEEIAEILGSTGQASNLNGEKVATLKVNLFGKKDANGNKVDVGNFVINQEITIKDDVKTCNNIGIDLGPTPKITVLAYRQQYSFYCEKDIKRNCNSQLFLFGQEEPVGNKYGYVCTAKDCPHRQVPSEDKEHCGCQYKVYVLVEVGEEKIPAVFYFKGVNFMQFSDYLKKLGKYPCCFFSATLSGEEKSKGSVDYYLFTLEPDLANPYPQEERLAYAKMAKEVSESIEQYKATQKTKAKKALPPGMSLAKDSEGKNAKQLTGGDAAGDLDDIQF